MSGFEGKTVPPLQFSPAQSQDHVPHLIEMLLEEFRNQMTTEGFNEKTINEDIGAAQPLLDFFESWLTANRPVQTFPVDANYGLVFSNSLRCVVSPGQIDDVAGTMQDSGAVSVTEGRSNPRQGGVIPVQTLPIR